MNDIDGYFPCFANRCKGRFVLRTNRQTGERFYGCSCFPACYMTRDLQSVQDEYAARVIGEFDNGPYYGEL